jgi:broad specificity phosphatase PhoE
MNIYLVRHGETSWNQEHRLQGLRDIPLNAAGIRQSRRLAEWHQKSASRRVISSPLVRAYRTAQIFVEHGSKAPLADDRLREIDHGPWTGMRLATIERRFPHEFATWNLYPEKLKLSNSESLASVYQRCTHFLMDVISSNSKEDVAVVSHGVVNALLLCAAVGACLSRIRQFSLANATVSLLKVQKGKIVAIERELDVGK